MKKKQVVRGTLVTGMLFAFLILVGCQNASLTEDPTPQTKAAASDLIITPPILRLVGFQGFSWERLPNGDIGPIITNVKITFTLSDGSFVKTIYTDASGHYKVTLPVGSYNVVATLAGYELYNSAPGFFVVTGTDGYETGNFFLKKLTYGFQGFTYVRNADGTIGPKLPNVTLTFTKNDGLYTMTIVSDASGYYKIALPEGGYYSTAQKAGYTTYTSAPGISIVDGLTYSTYNFFLTQ